MASDASLNVPYLVIAGVSLGAALIVFLIIIPQFNRVSTTQNEITSQTARLQERQDFLRTIDRKLTQLSQQKIHDDRLEIMLPESERIEDAIRVLHRASEASGITINNITNTSDNARALSNAAQARGQESNIPQNITPLSFTLDFAGSYQQFRAFLTELERSPRLMDISKIQMRGGDLSPGDISGQITAIFYAQKFNTSS